MKAIDYIRKGWTQGSLARDKDDLCVSIGDVRACSWCALGAIAMVYNPISPVYDIAVERLKIAVKDRTIARWNDNPYTTKKEVIAAFEKAGI